MVTFILTISTVLLFISVMYLNFLLKEKDTEITFLEDEIRLLIIKNRDLQITSFVEDTEDEDIIPIIEH